MYTEAKLQDLARNVMHNNHTNCITSRLPQPMSRCDEKFKKQQQQVSKDILLLTDYYHHASAQRQLGSQLRSNDTALQGRNPWFVREETDEERKKRSLTTSSFNLLKNLPKSKNRIPAKSLVEVDDFKLIFSPAVNFFVILRMGNPAFPQIHLKQMAFGYYFFLLVNFFLILLAGSPPMLSFKIPNLLAHFCQPLL